MKLLLFIPILLFSCSQAEEKKQQPKPDAPKPALTCKIGAAEKDGVVKNGYARFDFDFQRRNSDREASKIPVTFELACNGVIYRIPESDFGQHKELTVSPGVYRFQVTSDVTSEPLLIDSVGIRRSTHQSIDVILDYDPMQQTQHP